MFLRGATRVERVNDFSQQSLSADAVARSRALRADVKVARRLLRRQRRRILTITVRF